MNVDGQHPYLTTNRRRRLSCLQTTHYGLISKSGTVGTYRSQPSPYLAERVSFSSEFQGVMCDYCVTMCVIKKCTYSIIIKLKCVIDWWHGNACLVNWWMLPRADPRVALGRQRAAACAPLERRYQAPRLSEEASSVRGFEVSCVNEPWMSRVFFALFNGTRPLVMWHNIER